nr:3482_t:CDS:10 [Entrophospora candida]
MNFKPARFSGLIKKINSNNNGRFMYNKSYNDIINNNKNYSINRWNKPKTISEQSEELKSKKSAINYKESHIFNKSFDFKQVKKDDFNNVFSPVVTAETRKTKFSRKAREKEEDEEEDFELIIDDDKPKKKPLPPPIEQKIQKAIFIPEAISVSNLAKIIGERLELFEAKLKTLGIEYTSYDHLLNSEVASLIAMEYDLNPVVNVEAAIDLFPKPKPLDMSQFPNRPPIVTIFGHIDHGKTTLLDALRKSSIVAKEAGGITQHIGAFSVLLPSQKVITFLDTPGHAAFSAMRARGANVTDIVILVVAADDGVMPQTIEAITHAQSANVPIIVAINKVDKHGGDPNKIRQSLLLHGVQLEEYGGETQSVEISALTGKGLDDLEEAIIALAELLDIRAEFDMESEGKRGYSFSETRNLEARKHNSGITKQALPGTPVKVTGWKELPNAGDEVLEAKDEDLAKIVVENRKQKELRDKQLKDLEVINEKRRIRKQELDNERSETKNFKKEVWMFHKGLLSEYPTPPPPPSQSDPIKEEKTEENKIKELNLVVKGDVSGSVEAVIDALYGLGNNEVRVNVVDFGVGEITESDIEMASVAKGFNVKVNKKVQNRSKVENVEINCYQIIYKLLDDIKARLSEMLPPRIEINVTGEASVIQNFQINVKGKNFKSIAGCRVTKGTIRKNQSVKIIRNKKEIWEGALETLKHIKKDVNEVNKGLECGVSFNSFEDFRVGDIIQSLEYKKIPRTL